MPKTGIPAALADEFAIRRPPGRIVIVRHDVAGALEHAGLLESPDAGDHPAPAGGRGGARIPEVAGAGRVLVRPGRRGGWIGRVVHSRYFLGDRFAEELVLTERLRRRGAPVPEALAAVRRPRRIGYETWLITRWLEGAIPAAHALDGAEEAGLAELLAAMGRAVGALHAAGGDHADLNAWNVVITPPGGGDDDADDAPRARIVDLDRGRLRKAPLGARRARRNLARLRRSLRKLELDEALGAWPEFERGYASAR